MTADPRDLLIKLFDYIGEQLKTIDPRGFHLSKSNGFLRKPLDISGLPGVELDIRLEGDHVWMRVPRLEAGIPPKVPVELLPFISVSPDPNAALPSLNPEAILQKVYANIPDSNLPERSKLEDEITASAQAGLDAYTAMWKAWAEGERPRRKTISLYSDLFALKHHMEAEETTKPIELVWGIGVASWKMSHKESKFDFQYPLLSQAVEILLDEKTMGLEIRPRSTDTSVNLEAFVACYIPGASEVEKSVRDHIARNAEKPVSPFDPSSYTDILKLIVTNLDSEGRFQELLSLGQFIPEAAEDLIVSDCWVILSRPRTTSFLVADIKRLQEKLRGGCDIPAGPLSLVSPPSDEPLEFEPINFRGLSSRGETGKGEPKELYFPLPYNDEQVTIVQRLEQSAGVTVQGPPGTGKTHTIANIICHYLASGKRVLVTSRGEPALEVLQSKIPEEVRPLTVALLTSDREAIRQFQASIEAIQHRVSHLNPGETCEEIGNLKKSIDRAHSELTQIDHRVDEIAIAQLSEIEIDGVPMRAQIMAELVVSGQSQFGWFDDELSISPEHQPPFSEDEVGRLREIRRALGIDIIYATAHVPPADQITSVKEITELHDVLCRIKQIDGDEQDGRLIPLKSSTSNVLHSARLLFEQIDLTKPLIEEIEFLDDPWPMELRRKCRLQAFKSERQALEALFEEIDQLVLARTDFMKRPVELPDAALNTVKTKDAIDRAAETGKPFGFISLGVGESKTHIAAIRISGLEPKGIEDWAHIKKYVALHDKITSFLVRWNQFAETLSVPVLWGAFQELRTIEQVANAAKIAHRLGFDIDKKLRKQAEDVFETPPIDDILGSSEQLDDVRLQLIKHLARADLAKATTGLSILQESLAGCSGPASEAIRKFMDEDLGNVLIDTSRVTAKYAELISELRRIAGLTTELATIQDFAKQFEDRGAPKLAARVRTIPVASSGEDKVLPSTWRRAWNWARVKSHLESIEARGELLTMAARRRDLEMGLSRLYEEMVSKAAWLATKQTSTERVAAALARYATAITRIGQGTGPNAVRYRRDARNSMLEAAGAVPCWIMSHTKISESMPADFGAFDLVIVDEASQSDLWALPAIVRGKKILVVGDDKQVSPDGGFIASRQIDELKTRFLMDQPYGVEMTPEKSLYDLAACVFAAKQVMLREHFRCVPPIIAYSNRVFYGGGIQPLRIPTASERIDPPLVDIYVENGLRDHRDRNYAEAEAITAEIAAILADERFARRTLGVVSLLGTEQAKYVDEEVRKRCSSIELQDRKFECGEARRFQGSERDIMFLSMVVDPMNCKALSGNMFDQRFNVAASRARDRMYLVRSVNSSHLSDKDLRLGLLRHFDMPIVSDDADIALLIDRCESGFERDVYSELVKRGYQVIPQVKAGAYRIDMVAEGGGDTRLAIECDGDEYHGPDKWQLDMKRQRVLERAGWTFWRCFASTWSLHKEEVLHELIERLDAMGIEPIGALDRAPSLVEKRTRSFIIATMESSA